MNSILLVEDDSMISSIYQKKFLDAGFDIEIAVSGKEVIEKAAKKKYDLILLDLVLPEMSGMEALKALKDDGGAPSQHAKVVVFSNLSGEEEQALALGADGFLSKTRYNPSELVAEVRRLLGHYEEREKNNLRQAEFTAQSVVTASAGKKGKRRILLIEDEEALSEIFGEKLKTDGYDVSFARNGAWGVREALSEKFDLVIMDVSMPAMNGVEMLGQIRAVEKLKNLPVIVVSASMRDEEEAELRQLGISECFLKTKITPLDLARKVGEILNIVR